MKIEIAWAADNTAELNEVVKMAMDIRERTDVDEVYVSIVKKGELVDGDKIAESLFESLSNDL